MIARSAMRIGLPNTQMGFTLIELIVAIVVIAIASLTAVGLTTAISTRSAEELRREQAITIANSYMQEIIAKPFTAAGGGTRATHNDVQDYNGLNDAQVRDHLNAVVPGLAGYSAQITVTPQAFGGIGSPNARLITVTVTDPSGQQVTIQALVTNT